MSAVNDGSWQLLPLRSRTALNPYVADNRGGAGSQWGGERVELKRVSVVATSNLDPGPKQHHMPQHPLETGRKCVTSFAGFIRLCLYECKEDLEGRCSCNLIFSIGFN